MTEGDRPLPPLPRRASGARPRFHDEPAVDRLIAMVVALTSEVSVLADRVATLEQLSGIGHGAVDSHVPDLVEREWRETRREALVARVFAALDDELEGLARSGSEAGYWETIDRIERGEL
ncbi:MAG: hypothetical protein ACK4TG_06175 [Thermaurantiacus sp.]